MSEATPAGPRIVVPLDYSNAADALAMASRLDPARCRVKVGKELFTGAGPGVVEALHGAGHEVFLDLKFHDIPNTVAGACRAAAELGVWMLNVHAAGGNRIMVAAREAVAAAGAHHLVIGRPITAAPDPLRALEAIEAELEPA